MIEQAPRDPALRVSLAHVHNAVGDTESAVNLQGRMTCARVRRPYWSLANTKSYRFSGGHDQGVEPRHAATDRIQMHFALEGFRGPERFHGIL